MATSRSLLVLGTAIVGLLVAGILATGWLHPVVAASRGFGDVFEPIAGRANPAADAEAPEVEPFTVGDVSSGRVEKVRYDAFWERERRGILARPCTDGSAGGVGVVVFVGADAVWTELLSAAMDERAASCAAG